MSATTSIEWTDRTWNPVRGCSVISPGCHNCYAMKTAHRFNGEPKGKFSPYFGLTKMTAAGPQWTGKIQVVQKALHEPLSWRKPQRIFVNSMSDLFHEGVPDEFIDKVFDVMWRTPRHTYQILTKRPERMVDYIQTRASHRRFGWTDQGRHAMHPGEFIHLDDIRMRNMCGYVGDADWACDHKAHGGVEDSCSEYECPLAVRVDEREKLRVIGVEDEYRYGADGYAEDSQWMELTDRPLHGACGNVWLGFSAENQKLFEERMRIFRSLRWILGPHFTLFVSLEPLLGPIEFTIPYWPKGDDENDAPWSALSQHDFSDGSGPCERPYLDWVIVGGESGPKARPFDLEWARSIVQQCKAAGVAAFVKQLGKDPREANPYGESHPVDGLASGGYRLLLKDSKGGTPNEWPEDLRVREFPKAVG